MSKDRTGVLARLALTAAGCLLIAAPAHGGEEKTMDLSSVRAEFMEAFEALRDNEGLYGMYRQGPRRRPDLYASLDVALMRTIMGEELKETLTEEQRAEWAEHINSFAKPDGTYTDALGGHSLLHANGMVISALGPLGGKQPYPVSLYDEFNTVEKVVPWLENAIDWSKQWGASHLFWGGMHCFSMSEACTDAWREAVFEWLDANLDPETGWWRQGTEYFDRHQPLGGSVHILPIYQHHHRRFPYPERVIDSVLAMQLEDGAWLEYPGDNHMTYLELDALYALAYMQTLAPDYRAQDIESAVKKYGDLVIDKWPDHKDGLFLTHPHNQLAAVGCFGLLQQLDPERFRDTVRWTDIFSDIRFYQTDKVETLPR